MSKPVIYEDLSDPLGDRMDSECVPICDALNALDGIETIASCCGHGYAPFRIYFKAGTMDALRPILEMIDESEDWHIRVSMATGNMEIYFVLDGPLGPGAYPSAIILANVIRATVA